jgi:surface antigen
MLLSLLIGGCQTLETRNCEGVSTGVGALIGGVLGSRIGDGSERTAATLVGAGLGGLIGREIGTRLTCEDRQAMNAVLDRTDDGESASWRNPETGNQFTLTPRETFEQGNQQCRHFDMEVVVDGKPRNTDGTACRRPDDQMWTTI